MSGLGAIPAMPAIPASALPAEVRTGTAADKKAYEAAMGFERILMQTVVKDMTKAGGLDDSPYASAIEDSVSDALVAGGGIGLGEKLFHALRPERSVAT